MPDLDLIKQEEQGAGSARVVCRGPLRSPGGGQRAGRDHVNRAALLP